MIKLKDILTEAEKDMRVGLDYLKSIQSDEPFNTSQPLYHLILRQNLDKVMKEGLKPSQPKSSTHKGVLKGELFSGVWLSSLDDVDSIVDVHMLPRNYSWEGVVLQIDGNGLDPNLFNIGIEIPLRLMTKVRNGEKISRNDYYKQSDEIVYLGNIPPNKIEVIS